MSYPVKWRWRRLWAAVVVALATAACGSSESDSSGPQDSIGEIVAQAESVPGSFGSEPDPDAATVESAVSPLLASAEGEAGVASVGSTRLMTLADAVMALAWWFEVAATAKTSEELATALEAIATPRGLAETEAALMSDVDFVTHRTMLANSEYSAAVDAMIYLVRPLTVEVENLAPDRVATTVWLTVVTVLPESESSSGWAEASYELHRFEFAFVEGRGWLLDSAAGDSVSKVLQPAPSLIRAADSVAMPADQILAILEGHVSVRGLQISQG